MTSMLRKSSMAAVIALSACGGGGQAPGIDPAAGGTREGALALQPTEQSVIQTVGNWQVTVTDLGLLPGGTMSSARAINDSGKVVGIATDASLMPQRVVWDLASGTVIATLPNLDPSSSAEPESINAAGQVSGTERISNSLSTGVFWDAAGAVFGLPALAGGSAVQITAHQINRDGWIVGSSREGAPGYRVHPVMWKGASAPVSLGLLGSGGGGTAFGINDAGHVVGEAASGTVSRGFLWRAGRMVDLGAVGGAAASSRAAVLNNIGLIAGTSDAGTIPVLWRYDPAIGDSTPTLQRLPMPAGLVLPAPSAINDGGDIAGSATLSNYAGTRAVLWRGGEAIDLGTWPGGRNSRAFGIHRDGRVVGEGDLDGSGLQHALVWTVAPATGTAPPPAPPAPPAVNTVPSVSLAAVGPTSLKLGTALQVQGAFTDPDNGPWSYAIDWGDGSRSVGTRSAGGSFAASHLYASTSPKGGFKVVLKVTDNAGAAGTSGALSVRVR